MATKTEEVGQKILSALDSNKETIHSYTFAQETGEDHQLVIGAIKSLQSLGNVSQDLSCHFTPSSSCCLSINGVYLFSFIFFFDLLRLSSWNRISLRNGS